MCGRLAKIYNI